MNHKKGRVGLRRALNQQSMATAMLELHCRQKADSEQPQKIHIFVVARQQHEFYPQVMHKLTIKAWDKLWVICGSTGDNSDRENILDFSLSNISKTVKNEHLTNPNGYL